MVAEPSVPGPILETSGTPMSAPDVVFVGGGVIGLSAAWRLAQSGAAVTVIDAGFDGRASWAAAGMLTPVTEAYWGEDALLALTVGSMARWPEFAADLERATGRDIGLELDGVLAVGLDTDDVAVIDDLHSLHVDHGLASTRLRSRECREHEPLLAPQVRGGLFAPNDGAVDPRRLVDALTVACHDAGVELRTGHVERFALDGDRVTGVVLGGETLIAPTSVLAAGSWSSLLDAVTGAVDVPVRPVYGEVMRLRERTPDHTPSHTIRAVVRGQHVYVVMVHMHAVRHLFDDDAALAVADDPMQQRLLLAGHDLGDEGHVLQRLLDFVDGIEIACHPQREFEGRDVVGADRKSVV